MNNGERLGGPFGRAESHAPDRGRLADLRLFWPGMAGGLGRGASTAWLPCECGDVDCWWTAESSRAHGVGEWTMAYADGLRRWLNTGRWPG